MNSEQIAGLVRHFITVAGGALVTRGLTDESGLQALAGGAAVFVAVVWSWWQKREAV